MPSKRPIFFARFEYLQLALSSCHRVTTSSDGSRRCPRINFHWQIVHAITNLCFAAALCNVSINRLRAKTFGFTFNVHDILRSVICREHVCVCVLNQQVKHTFGLSTQCSSRIHRHTLCRLIQMKPCHYGPRITQGPSWQSPNYNSKKKLRQCSSFSCSLLLTSQSIVASPTYHPSEYPRNFPFESRPPIPPMKR